MSHNYFGPSAARPPDLSRPCWTCHWFGFHEADQSYVACLNPDCSPNRSQPAHGCSQWLREPGADDQEWNPLEVAVRLSPEVRKAYVVERKRLDKIRATAVFGLMPWQPHPEVRGRSGTVEMPVKVKQHVLLRSDSR